MAIEVRPATVFADVEAVVGPKRPDANVCWCLSYRLTSSKENQALTGTERGAKVRELVAQDPPPGVLAYDGDEVVGWAGVHPRADTSFATNRRIPHVDDLDVWSVWCIRVRPGHRGEGISHHLLAGAVEFARQHGRPRSRGIRSTTGARRSTSPWHTPARSGCSRRRVSRGPPTRPRC
jgi:GNAT superfamily N-acetyltransferase